MKLTVLQGEHFSCRSCTNCCRDWHVELIAEEAERISGLKWAADDSLSGANVLMTHAGKTFLAHRADGACIFLNETNGRCRIHEQFGAAAKPLGCRLFPFQISPTFNGEASVTARFDCPTVRHNAGAPHADSLPELRQLASQMRFPDFLDRATCCFLERDQVQAICEFIATMIGGFERDEQRAMFIVSLANLLEMTRPDDIDRPNLAKIFPDLKRMVEAATSQPLRRPGWFARFSFRTLLGMYLRRDEDVLNRRASKIGRTVAMASLVLGGGNFHRLGLTHRNGKLRKARLFKPRNHIDDPQAFSLLWRLIRIKLESFQFLGAANGGRNLFAGLRSLALLYPLTRAVARYNAANRGSERIEPDDVDQAVAAIEHAFGRSPILSQISARRIETLLVEPVTFARLVRSI